MDLLARGPVATVIEYQDRLGIDWWGHYLNMEDGTAAIAADVAAAKLAGMKVALDVRCDHALLPKGEHFRKAAWCGTDEPVHKWLDRYASFCAQVAEELRPDLMEVWSENGCEWSWGAPPVAADYALLLHVARAAVPKRQIIGVGGFTGGVDIHWYHKLMSAGCQRYADVMCLHPYTFQNFLPRALGEMLYGLEAIRGGGWEIYLTEFGLPHRAPQGEWLSEGPPPQFMDGQVWAKAGDEIGGWWQGLLDLWSGYCVTAACYIERPFGGVSTDYWGDWIGVAGTDAESILKKRFATRPRGPEDA